MLWWNPQQGKVTCSIEVPSVETPFPAATNCLKSGTASFAPRPISYCVVFFPPAVFFSLCLTCRSPPNTELSRTLFIYTAIVGCSQGVMDQDFPLWRSASFMWNIVCAYRWNLCCFTFWNTLKQRVMKASTLNVFWYHTIKFVYIVLLCIPLCSVLGTGAAQ